jgi:DHA3 family tetracycline resistance protein-like MFS transporter
MGFVGALLGIIATQLIARRIDTTNHQLVSRVLLLLATGQIASVVAFGLAGGFWWALLVSQALGVFRHLLEPLHAAWLNQGLDPRYRATVLSMRGQVDAFGQIAGGPLIGLIGTWFSLRAALVAAGLILLPALPLFARAHGQARAGTGRPAESGVEAAVAAPSRSAGRAEGVGSQSAEAATIPGPDR